MLRLGAIAALLLAMVSLATSYLANQPSLIAKPGASLGGSANLPVEQARAILARRPLHAAAYFVLAIDEERRGDEDAAAALMDRAASINPRLSQARLWRAQHHLRRGRPGLGVNEIAVLFQIRRGSQPALARLLAQGSRDPALRRLIAARFANQPAMIGILGAASDAGLSAASLAQIAARTDFSKLPGGVEAAQRAATSGLLRDKKYGEAHAIWRTFLRGRSPGLIHDPAFRGIEGAPPFGWTLTTSGDVEVQIVSSGLRDHPSALQVRQFGSLPSVAAEQSLLLPPGDYLLRFRARADGPGPSGAYWAIRCTTGKLIAEEPIRATLQWTQQSWRFSTPANCPLEVIELRGRGREGGPAPALLVTGLELQGTAAPGAS